MTERERWVVYPLLFLALGAALRDKLVDRTVAKSIVCEELTIVSDSAGGHEQLAKIGHTEATAKSPSAYLYVNGEVQLDGTVRVNGTLSAQQYVGVPAVIAVPAPAFELLRGMQQPAVDPQQNKGIKKPPAKQLPPPGKSPTTEGDSLSAPSKSNGGGKSTPDK